MAELELYAVAAVYMGNAVVIDPGTRNMIMRSGSTKRSIRPAFFPLGVLVNDELQALKYFADCLKELGLVGIALSTGVIDSLKILICNHCFFSLLLKKLKTNHLWKHIPYFSNFIPCSLNIQL